MPATFAQHENGVTYAATGFDPVNRWDGLTEDMERAGTAAPTLAVQLAGADDGPIFGTYWAYQRWVDRLGGVSNVSPISEALILDSVSGTITTMTNVTVDGVTYTRLHSTGISDLLTNGNVVVISGVNGMTGIDGVYYYYADPNGDTDDFFLQESQAQVLATGTYTSGGTWTGPSGTITAAEHVTVAGTSYTRLTSGNNIWSSMRDGTTITLDAIGGISGLHSTWAYRKDTNGATNTFFVTTFPTPVDAGTGPYTSGGTWTTTGGSLTNAVEVIEGALDGTGTRYTRFTSSGIWSAVAEGETIKIAGVTGIGGVNGSWTFGTAIAPYGTTDDFTIASGSVKQLATPASYTGGGTITGAQTGSNTITAASDIVGPAPGLARYTRMLVGSALTAFTNGDQVTISGLAGAQSDLNGTWFLFKDSTTHFYVSTSNTGTPRFRSSAISFAGGAGVIYRSPAFGPFTLTRIEQVVDSFGPYSRLLCTTIATERQDRDSVTIAGITGEFAELNGTWDWFRDLTAAGAVDYFNLELAGVTQNASVTYGHGGTYATDFGTITDAAQVTVSGVTRTRITSAGIQSLLTAGDTITVASVGGFAGLTGTWYYQPDPTGTTDQFYVTVIPVAQLGTGTYTIGGTWTAPDGTIDDVDHVTVDDVSFTRLTATTDGISSLLTDGTQITLAGIGGINGLTGSFIYYADPDGADDTFFVQSASSGVLGVGDYSGGAQWVKGHGQINYSNVEAPTDAQITRRQILRNADGDTTTFYVDIDTDDLTATTFTSTRTDTELTAQEAVPLFDSNQVDLAISRYGIPPNDLPLLLNARSRLLFSGSAVYSQGAVAVTNGSATVTGIGTKWTTALAGRLLCLHEEAPATISAVNTETQTLTLTEAWAGTTSPYADYSIRSDESRRRLVAWSEAGLPEAVPPTSAFQLTREGTAGDITAMFLLGSLCYLAENGRMHVLNFSADPAPSAAGGDGAVFHANSRGAVNQRCVVVVEDIAFVLDRQGVHAVSQQGDNSVSDTIHEVFDSQGDYRYRLRWHNPEFFHGIHDPGQELIFWFVAMDSRKYPHFALVYDYRGQRWALAEYQFPITCSVLALIDGKATVLVGSSLRRMFALEHGTLDGAPETEFTLSGALTDCGFFSLEDSAATFTEDVIGLPVTLLDGDGRGQQRTIISVTDTELVLQDPWIIMPDVGDQYAIGAIPYEWKSGTFRFPPTTSQEERSIEIINEHAANGTAAVQIYLNRSETPSNWGANATDKGVTTVRNTPRAVVDLTRSFCLSKMRLDGLRTETLDGPRFLEVQIAGAQTEAPITFLEATIDGVTQ